MSLDPAQRLAEVPERVQSLAALFPEKGHVYVFDFDGVLTDPLDNDIYAFQPWNGEDAFLDEMAQRFGIACQGMETRYRRHLLHQAAALTLGLNMKPGPAFEHARLASRLGKLFILTARSGWYAVERLRLFLKRENLCPIDVFCVGRANKNQQLDLLCQEFPAVTINYVDDSRSHVASASTLTHENLNVFLAERLSPRQTPEAMKNLIIETIEQGARMFEKSVALQAPTAAR